MSLWEALTFARDRRAIIAPNVGFMAQARIGWIGCVVGGWGVGAGGRR